jgi:AmmeMemoRadiSam system protein B
MATIRKPAVAGMFYPADPGELGDMVGDCLSGARGGGNTTVPKAIIAPHAGLIYSGPVAASAYVRLEPARATITRVVLIGPSHRVALKGLALPGNEAFATPFGPVKVDAAAVAAIAALPQVSVMPAAHAEEHSLEVHLPFLQRILDDFTLVPLVAGDATADEVAEVLELLWGGAETLIVISSDLSHYHDYETAKRMDAQTSEAIEALDGDRIGYDDACGRVPVRGLLAVARRRGLRAATIDLRNSGDTAGPRDQVVGYGAYVINWNISG